MNAKEEEAEEEEEGEKQKVKQNQKMDDGHFNSMDHVTVNRKEVRKCFSESFEKSTHLIKKLKKIKKDFSSVKLTFFKTSNLKPTTKSFDRSTKNAHKLLNNIQNHWPSKIN